jgi:hypothetical protein
MVWECPACNARVPQDLEELQRAQFCRHCGSRYYDGAQATASGADETAAEANGPLPESRSGVAAEHGPSVM